MARAKKKKRSTRAKAKVAPKRGDKASGKKTKAKAKAGPKKNDVEHRWREYWQCRTALEKSVAAVRDAQQNLAEARQLERTRREVFDQTKNALKDLLEVEPAGGTTSALLDFPGEPASVNDRSSSEL